MWAIGEGGWNFQPHGLELTTATTWKKRWQWHCQRPWHWRHVCRALCHATDNFYCNFPDCVFCRSPQIRSESKIMLYKSENTAKLQLKTTYRIASFSSPEQGKITWSNHARHCDCSARSSSGGPRTQYSFVAKRKQFVELCSLFLNAHSESFA